MLIYVAGPYRASTKKEIQENIQKAKETSFDIIRAGHYPVCPHTMTQGWCKEGDFDIETILQCDFEIVKKCDALLLLPGWERSEGACREKELAETFKKPIYYKVEEIPEDPYPLQFAEFDKLVQEMSSTHRRKNRDYSSQNIAASGIVGIISRILDKVCRILSLEGWEVEIKFKEIHEPKEAEYESVEDAYRDLSVYSNIAIIWKKGLWGK